MPTSNSRFLHRQSSQSQAHLMSKHKLTNQHIYTAPNCSRTKVRFPSQSSVPTSSKNAPRSSTPLSPFAMPHKEHSICSPNGNLISNPIGTYDIRIAAITAILLATKITEHMVSLKRIIQTCFMIYQVR